METLTTLLPYLDWAAGAGAGVLASFTFDWLRATVTPSDRWPAWLYGTLYTARYARYINIALAIVFGVAAASAAALIRSEPVASAADATLAAMIGSLITHARRSLPTEPLAINSAPGAAIEFEDDPHE